MNRGPMGREWMVKRGVYCFKITIEDGHNNTIEQAMETASRLPSPYIVGLEIVSDDNENGMALYKDLGGAAGHGGRTYCNLVGLDIGVLIHELGHAIEQEVRLTLEADLLDRWKSEAIELDGVSVSGYGNSNPWEDMAEFTKIYSTCLQTGKLQELEKLSPNRFKIWHRCVKLVNTSLRQNKCEAETEQPGPGAETEQPEPGVSLKQPLDYEPDPFWTSSGDRGVITTVVAVGVALAALLTLFLLLAIFKRIPGRRKKNNLDTSRGGVDVITLNKNV